ncbi:phosphoglycerate mutase [Longibacter salinarum]|uniref:Phosphoglycerate mutase n=2 Tax=Longibacter salinarum TaxID=1850348 RepID=A0A2A8D3N8_9BACT|nr:phosphoglycerate mutase [Longibacter salinarum]
MLTTDPTPPEATVLYFVRHGETEYNRKGIVQGSGIDSVLNETGRSQAQRLGRRFAAESIDVVYSSTLVRAKQTADIVTKHLESVERCQLDDLREMSWGVLEGEPPSDTRDSSLEEIKTFWSNGKYGHAVDGGESILDVRERAVRAAQHIVEVEGGRNILAVTHGRFLRVLLASICEDYDLSHMSTLGHSNTCVNRVVYRDGVFRADLLNCTSHLATAA